MTYVLMIMMALGQQMQVIQGFQTKESCEAVLKQVKHDFRPRAASCIEVKQ